MMPVDQCDNYICLIEDDVAQAGQLEYLLEKHLSCRVERISMPFSGDSLEPEELRNLFVEQNKMPLFILTDICLYEGETEVIADCLNKGNFQDLFDISGVNLLTWLRHNYRTIPVISMSAYWDNEKLPDLSQHSLLFLYKDYLFNKPESYIPYFKIANINIFGIFLNRELDDNFVNLFNEITSRINNCQDSFYFHIARDGKELITPPEKFLPFSAEYESKKIAFEIWCKKITGIINFIPVNLPEIKFSYSVPFGMDSIHTTNVYLFDIFEFIGYERSALYITREYLRIIYKSFFKIELHDSTNPKCLFTDSIYEDSFPKNEQVLCATCISNIRKQRNFTDRWLKHPAVEKIVDFLHIDTRTEIGDAR